MKWLMSCPPLVLSAALLVSGCLPPALPAQDLTRFNIANYSANTDSTGWGGTWMVTANGLDYNGIQLYRRFIVRLESVADSADTYRLHGCGDHLDGGGTASVQTVVASGNTLELPLQTTIFLKMQMQADGHASAAWSYYASEDMTIPHDAVRISSDPQHAIGTFTQKQSIPEPITTTGNVDCFQEQWQGLYDDVGVFELFVAARKPLGDDVYDIFPSAQLDRYGESSTFFGAIRQNDGGPVDYIQGNGTYDTVRSTTPRVTGSTTDSEQKLNLRFNIRF